MYLKSLRLRDWKAYVDLDLNLPPPTSSKNVVLIGANNGYGKTSILEALLLGLFGKDAFPLISRSSQNTVAGSKDSAPVSWVTFLERAFYAKAAEQGRHSMSIEVTLDDDFDGPTTIKRIWHFSPNRQYNSYKAGEDEVLIYLGEERDIVRIPRLEEDREDYIRSLIVQRFLPAQLAQFFLFDGEQVQALARQQAKDQVKQGLEGILGVKVLRVLQQDLETYSANQQKATRDVDSSKLNLLREEVLRLEADARYQQGVLDEQLTRIERVRGQRQQLTREISALLGGTVANSKDLQEEKQGLVRERDKVKGQLAELVQKDLAITLAGTGLLGSLRTRLEQEAVRQSWEASCESTRPRLAILMKRIRQEDPPFDPPLSPRQRETLEMRVTQAWDSLWNPPPGDPLADYRHPYLSSQDRAVLSDRLQKLEKLRIGQLEGMLDLLSQCEQGIKRCNERLAQLEGSSDKYDRLAAEIEALNREEQTLDADYREGQRLLTGQKGHLAEKKAALGQMEKLLLDAEPGLRKARTAKHLIELIESLIKEASPEYITRLAESMTSIYKGMAHKQRLHHIEIDQDCDVRMIAEGGRELRSLDASAGEDQIFALSLIAAIAEISERQFPVIMDTPLARLDTRHRLNVLKHFTEKAGEQVILLSTPEEVRGPFLDAIRHRVCGAWLIEHDELGGGVGRSRLKQGYFERV